MKGEISQKSTSATLTGWSCNKCKYWEKYSDADEGICRFNPPVTDNDWPETEPDDWCGKYET